MPKAMGLWVLISCPAYAYRRSYSFFFSDAFALSPIRSKKRSAPFFNLYFSSWDLPSIIFSTTSYVFIISVNSKCSISRLLFLSSFYKKISQHFGACRTGKAKLLPGFCSRCFLDYPISPGYAIVEEVDFSKMIEKETSHEKFIDLLQRRRPALLPGQ